MSGVNYKTKTIEIVKVQFNYRASDPIKQVKPISFCDILEHEDACNLNIKSLMKNVNNLQF